MSANIFPIMSKPKESRIPVLSSPTPLRRAGSLRLRSENRASNQTTPASNRTAGFQAPQDNKSALLKRGNSFMERGERQTRHGASAVAARPRNFVTTEPRNPKALKGPTTPQSPSRIRSLSLSLSTTRLNAPRSPSGLTSSPKTPPTSPDVKNRSHANIDWDTESITSLTSVTSVGSCDHASVARNGTTFSGRSMKYVFHCNQHAGATGEDYLTPTQRVHRQVKKLKHLLAQAKKDLEEKDSDILKLTKEVVELRLYKAALNSPEDKSNSSDAVTVRENTTDEQITPDVDTVDRSILQNEMTNSYTDSGHFEDYTNSPISSKDAEIDGRSVSACENSRQNSDFLQLQPRKRRVDVADKAITAALGDNTEHTNLILEYEKKIQELVKTHEEESYQLKQKHNDKVEELLQRITEINKRYWELVPELDLAKEKIKELESQLEEACQKLAQQEEKQKKTYLEMYNQGQEAARLERENKVMEIARQGPSRISVPELLEELQVTKNELENIKDLEYASTSNNLQPLLSAKEALSLWVLGARKAMYRQLMEAKSKNKIDPEITLQFLKSAIYYFLTDRENSQGHLKAIQSILGFTPIEISSIDKARLS
ncbi:myosin heavy chain, clone 203 [Asbolus verrucosus]|uniref:Myosin heavy chain, clone 203 n=1 Tax=Asbolus verrucosus TaxID=1661398 RepID=A0A482VYM7_ASBVE|nr:myosin heavy chain, clone 203 [Asbolus verrucosus]